MRFSNGNLASRLTGATRTGSLPKILRNPTVANDVWFTHGCCCPVLVRAASVSPR